MSETELSKVISVINATTKLFPIIGAPVSGVFSPPAFNAWFTAHDINCRMMALEVPHDGLAQFLGLLRISPSMLGCSVTYPHKQGAFNAVDNLTDRAQRVGAINTIRREPDGRLTGDATDGAAMCEAITAKGFDIAGSTARVVGAGGGAGRAIVDALCSSGVAEIALEDHNRERLEETRVSINQRWPQVQIAFKANSAGILVNATSLGKSATDSCPFDKSAIAQARIVCDVVTCDALTPLITQATQQGKITITGNEMGAGQLAPQTKFMKFS